MSSVSSTNSRRSRDYDTGFPDSFAQRTTSLRHPDANTGPGASISQEDIDPAKTLLRSRKSFGRKYKRTISHGRITPEMVVQYANNSAPAIGSIDSAIDVSDGKGLLVVDDRRSSKDGTESINRTTGSPTEVNSRIMSHPEKTTGSPRRTSLFGKLRRKN